MACAGNGKCQGRCTPHTHEKVLWSVPQQAHMVWPRFPLSCKKLLCQVRQSGKGWAVAHSFAPSLSLSLYFSLSQTWAECSVAFSNSPGWQADWLLEASNAVLNCCQMRQPLPAQLKLFTASPHFDRKRHGEQICRRGEKEQNKSLKRLQLRHCIKDFLLCFHAPQLWQGAIWKKMFKRDGFFSLWEDWTGNGCARKWRVQRVQ